MEKVILIKKGCGKKEDKTSYECEVTIQEAERKLRAKRVNPNQTWALKEGGEYYFDGNNIVKSVKKVIKEKEPEIKATPKD